VRNVAQAPSKRFRDRLIASLIFSPLASCAPQVTGY